ncbi:hypothetical protein [Lactococcus cremoris]|nr:hypothetical protein [Lactococcus cremoris]
MKLRAVDIIVSNPPYIAFDETYEMDDSVINISLMPVLPKSS